MINYYYIRLFGLDDEAIKKMYFVMRPLFNLLALKNQIAIPHDKYGFKEVYIKALAG